MCGGESTIRIDTADNGYSIDAYHPGGEGKPGKHKKLVARTPEEVSSLLKGHLGKMRVKGGRKERASHKPKKAAAKRMTRKEA